MKHVLQKSKNIILKNIKWIYMREEIYINTFLQIKM